MRHASIPALFGLCLLISTVASSAETPVLTLYDIETGIEGWQANPWGGGEVHVALSDAARFGDHSIRCNWVNVERGGTAIAPYFAEDAPWRGDDYDSISFWLKGDGTPSSIRIICEVNTPGGALTYSGGAPMDNTDWRRFHIKFGTMWNREKVPFEPANLARIYFSMTGTHEAHIDQISLQRRMRQLPLFLPTEPIDFSPTLWGTADAGYWLNLSPEAFGAEAVTVTLDASLPGSDARSETTIPAAAPVAETWLPLPGVPAADGAGTLTLTATADGRQLYAGNATFPVALPAQALSLNALQLVPQPKSIMMGEGRFELPEQPVVAILSHPDTTRGGQRKLVEDLARYFGRRAAVADAAQTPQPVALMWLGAPGGRPTVPDVLTARFGDIREQGYLLDISPDGILMAAGDEAGMRYAAITVTQLLRSASPCAGQAGAPCLRIIDWPTLPTRAYYIGLPTTRWGHPNDATVPVEFFIDFLRRTAVDTKLNMVVIGVLQGMEFERHPEIAGPSAYTKAEVRQIVEFLKDNGVEPVPLIQSLGHANWLVIPIAALREDGDPSTLCTRHPDSRRILADCFDEALEVFEPKYLHCGLDEIRWQTFNKPESELCPLCKGIDKREILTDQVDWLHEYCREHGVGMMMWGDMIIREHNGGPPFFLADTVPQLPKDITICNWSTSLAPISSAEFVREGFEVIQSNSAGVNRLQIPHLVGNMWGIWSRVPWLTESCWDAYPYSYPGIFVAVEYSWNAYHDLIANAPGPARYFAQRPMLQARLASSGVSAGGAAVTQIGDVDESREPITIADIPLRPLDTPAKAAQTWQLDTTLSALYLLLAADLPAGNRTSFLEAFKAKQNWYGVPIADMSITYADGTERTQPVYYGSEVRALPVDDPKPHAWGALGWAPIGTGGTVRMAYLLEQPNPTPAVTVSSVTFTPRETGCTPILLGLAARSVR